MIKIVSDSSTLYSKEEAKKNNLDVRSLSVTIDNKSFKELEELTNSAHDYPYAPLLGNVRHRRYVRLEIAGTAIGFAGHCVFVERVGNRHAYSLIAYIKGYRSLGYHTHIIAQNRPSVYRLCGFFSFFRMLSKFFHILTAVSIR